MLINRRHLLIGSSAFGLSLSSSTVFGQARPRVLVIGGGPGGATAAKYIAKDSKGAIDVTLIEPSKQFVTCFHSNLYLGGFKDMKSITFGYGALKDHGVKVVHQRVMMIDREKKQVILDDNSHMAYDRLIVSPGIDLKYDSVPGWGEEHEEKMPHAWKAGKQTEILRARLDAVPDGGTIVMLAPPNPYRCPPGPYERVSMMAHRLKAAGKTKSKIIILDPKESFSKQGLFQEGWEKIYPGMVEWLGPKIHDGVKSVDVKSSTIVTGFETYKNVALVNVIPAQMAGKIARDAGLTNASGFCPINPENMQSANDPSIYILGDACIAGDMPKSAFAANSQAKIAAMFIRGELIGARTFPARYANTCWSLISPDNTVKVGGSYGPKDGKISAIETYVSKLGETVELRKEQQAENVGWYAGITADMFG